MGLKNAFEMKKKIKLLEINIENKFKKPQKKR